MEKYKNGIYATFKMQVSKLNEDGVYVNFEAPKTKALNVRLAILGEKERAELKEEAEQKAHEEAEEKKAVDAGYWHLYRYNPTFVGTEKNPFTLDSKDPTASYQEFLMGETRYAALKKAQPELAEKLFEKAEEENTARLGKYKKLAGK